MKFGLLFLAEFVEVVILAAVTTAIFLGGWNPIFFQGWLKANLDPMLYGAVCATAFLAKVILLTWLQLIIRWLLPRFRYDQIQALCWKLLLPGALINIFVTGAAVLVDPSLELLAWIGIVEIVAMAAITLAVSRPQGAAHGHDAHGHGHDDAHGHAAHAAGH
jgi:NADH-quinone oxidoreductase subunit H